MYGHHHVQHIIMKIIKLVIICLSFFWQQVVEKVYEVRLKNEGRLEFDLGWDFPGPVLDKFLIAALMN